MEVPGPRIESEPQLRPSCGNISSFLTHCTRLGIKQVPLRQPENCCSWILNPLRHIGNSTSGIFRPSAVLMRHNSVNKIFVLLFLSCLNFFNTMDSAPQNIRNKKKPQSAMIELSSKDEGREGSLKLKKNPC